MPDSTVDLLDHAVFPEDRLANSVRPTLAMVFHVAGAGRLAMVTSHGIRNMRSGVPTICAGKVLTPADEQQVFDLLMGRQKRRTETVLPPHCLLSRPDRFAYWIPSAVRPMHLAQDGRRWTIQTRWPTLVVQVAHRKMRVAALPGDAHPHADTDLFHAPVPNVYQDTALCTGDAVVPVDSSITAMDGWSSILFDTAFTHGNWAGGLATKDRDVTVESLWPGRDGITDPFPDSLLVPTGFTLGEWLFDLE